MDPRIGLVVLAVYAALLIAGGVVGFFKAGSFASLVVGVTCGIGSGAAAWLVATKNEAIGDAIGLILAGGLFMFFGVRLLKTRKFMPAGLLTLASIGVIAIMVWSITVPQSPA